MLSPLVKLATSAAPGERKYICLAGAGLSIDAGLPTGWGLMLATAALLRLDDPGDEAKKDETWFLESKYAEMKYSELIGGLFSTHAEQQSFMRKELRGDRPGKSHLLLAELARRGVLRCVITTNFDNLIEPALVGAGVPYQVIANDDDLKHSEPLIHCKQFRIYKPHGTLGVGQIRNTPADLKRLSGPMERELVKITRDHGLMVVGYAGADEGILRVFQKRKQSHYPTFWINPNEPPEHIPPMFGQETFTYVPCKGASTILGDLIAMYGKLSALAPASGLPASVLSVKDAIQGGRPDASAMVREFMTTLHQELLNIAPRFADGGDFDQKLVDSLETSKGICVEFANVAKAVAESNSEAAAFALYKGFGKLIEEYYPNLERGSHYPQSFDYWKFLGHELFVTFFSMLIREERWGLIASLLGEQIYLANGLGFQAGVIGFSEISQHVKLLDETRNRRLGLRRLSLRADMLNEWHTEGDLAAAVPADEFMDADFFLFLRAKATNETQGLYFGWFPWSVLNMKKTGPRYVLEAAPRKQAERLARAIGAADVAGLRAVVKDSLVFLTRAFYDKSAGSWLPPLYKHDISIIGSK